jgi:hypothetical protein
MKIALYIEDGFEQIVLTPEGETEKALCQKFAAGNIKVYRGQFFNCTGGWLRQGAGNDSIMISMCRSAPVNVEVE